MNSIRPTGASARPGCATARARLVTPEPEPPCSARPRQSGGLQTGPRPTSLTLCHPIPKTLDAPRRTASHLARGFVISLAVILATCQLSSCGRSPSKPPPQSGVRDLSPSWNPGTSLIAFYRHVPPDSDAALSGIYVADTLTRMKRQVLSGYYTSFDWIPRTDTLVVTDGISIQLLSTTTGVLSPLLQHPANDIELSPSGAHIAFDADRNGRSTIFVYDRATTSLVAPLSDTTVAKYASWSRSDTMLVTIIGTPSRTDIRAFRLDGTLDVPLFPRPPSARGLHCSPVDARIGLAGLGGDGAMRIAILDPNTTSQVWLYTASGGPSWAADGVHFVFSAPSDGGDRLYVGAIDGAPLRPVLQ